MELRIMSLIVRVIWRAFSIVILLVGVLSVLDLAVQQPTRPDPVLLICLPIFAAGLIAA